MQYLILALLTLGGLIAFALPVYKRVKIIVKAPGKLECGESKLRWKRVWEEVALQSKVIRGRPFAGALHGFVFWGFLAFIIVTLNHFVHGFGGDLLGEGWIYHLINAAVTVLAVFVIIGISGLAIRRFIFRPKALGEHLSLNSGIVALFIFTLMVTYLLDLYVLQEGTSGAGVNWWLHSVVILAFLALIPQSKHLHLALSPFTVFWKDLTLARIKPLDIEKEEIGAEKLSDLEKHTVLGAFSCVECGRCLDHCPAQNTRKVLNPKQWMLDIRKGLLAQEGKPASEYLNFDMIWQCTTCGACTYQCPVGIDQVIPLIAFRRGFVSNGEFPPPMRSLFDNLERSGNPWKYQPSEVEKFIASSEIPLYENQETLYWMGCMGRFDAQYQKVAKTFSDLLKTAKIEFGVLLDEKCTGDAVRRAGNEFLFLSLAEENITNLNAAKAKTIVTTCPHCARTLWEYRDLGLRKDIKIIHHSFFLLNLVKSGKLKSNGKNTQKMVYHDSCYLSRYQAPQGFTAPRELLAEAGAHLQEVKRTRDTSFCCGAGGGMLFSEETEGKRINHERTEELIATGVDTIATSCPFCQLMIRDGLSDLGKEGVAVKDIAQMLQK